MNDDFYDLLNNEYVKDDNTSRWLLNVHNALFCEKCGGRTAEKTGYCPHCGRRMVGDDNVE